MDVDFLEALGQSLLGMTCFDEVKVVVMSILDCQDSPIQCVYRSEYRHSLHIVFIVVGCSKRLHGHDRTARVGEKVR